MALVLESEPARDFRQIEAAMAQQTLRLVDAPLKDILVRSEAGALLEQPAEVIRTQVSGARQVVQAHILRSIGLDIFQHRRELAIVEAAVAHRCMALRLCVALDQITGEGVGLILAEQAPAVAARFQFHLEKRRHALDLLVGHAAVIRDPGRAPQLVGDCQKDGRRYLQAGAVHGFGNPHEDGRALRIDENASGLQDQRLKGSRVHAQVQHAVAMHDRDAGPEGSELLAVERLAAALQPDEIAPRRIRAGAFDCVLRVGDAPARSHFAGENLRLVHGSPKDQAGWSPSPRILTAASDAINGGSQNRLRYHRVRIMRTVPALFCATLLLCSASASGFESDVHYGLTEWLARKAGFDEREARTIATGNHRVDSGDMQYIDDVLIYACLGKDDVGAKRAGAHHYPSAGAVPGAPESRAVVADGPVARQGVAAMTKIPAE